MTPALLNKTLSWGDLDEPAARAMARRLFAFLLRWSLAGGKLAVNGVLRRRWYVRRHKMWEYARGLAYSAPSPGQGILDFGGGATLPLFFLARQRARVKCLDIDPWLSDYTNRMAESSSLPLEASSKDVTREPFPSGWDAFDRIYSFSVLEHLPKKDQAMTLRLLGERLRPGGRLVLTFDFGADAPEEGAIQGLPEVERLIASSGLELAGGKPFRDTGERFVLNRRHPNRRFTFGQLFLEKT